MSRLLAQLIRLEHLAPIAVIGHSAGAALALQLAHDGALDRSTAIIGINPALAIPPSAMRALLDGQLGELLRSPAARAAARWAGRAGPLIELLVSSTGSQLTPAQEARYVEAFSSGHHAEGAYAMVAHWDLAPLLAVLPSLPHEVLFIVGTRDRWVPAAAAEAAAARLTHARLERIAGGGHLVHEERAPDVARRIRAFLAARSPTPSTSARK